MKLEQRGAAEAGSGLWKGLGMWAWVLFRVSGLVLALYLFVHIWVISQGRVGGPERLNELFAFFDKPLLVFLDLMLVAAVLYHALNGVRIILMDLGFGLRRHKAIFWVCMALAALALGVFAFRASSFILG
ncbi:MAG TPA: succinate dehydrogenase, cytochrome b556 subunit [Thermoleophilia bacterium]|nr:succinate dehydrogenase, cytochrome b556 subunit [Thermoleophilia bacterium]